MKAGWFSRRSAGFRRLWQRDWLQRLSGQLVLSHVFVAVVVLAFALGVAQVTFRQYLVRSQFERLSAQGRAITQVLHGFFVGTMSFDSASLVIQDLQGTLNDRVYVVNNAGGIEPLQGGRGNVPLVPPTESALVQVFEQNQTYRGIVAGNLLMVGVPVSINPGSVDYGVFLESPLSLTNRTAGSLTRLLLFAELAAVILVGALAYAVSQRLSMPLENLRQVVAGAGQQGEDQNLRATEGEGPVEVQALAHEFNRLEDRIEAQVAQLTREAEARDALMAHVAHDLRTPLTSIRGFLEAVRDGVATGESHDRAVEVAWEETLRLQRLVDRLLKATRIRSEGGPMAPVSVHDWVQKTVERVTPVLEQKNLHLLWDQDEDGIVWGNEDYLMEALLNLLDNAMKWSPQGGRIRIETECRGEHMAVRVADEGPGIPEEILPRVFERFVTGDASRQQSSGLGLSIVDEVARQHHGEVTIRSSESQGTVVEIQLPLFQGA